MRKRRLVIIFCALLAALVQSAFSSELKADLRDFAVRTWGTSEGLPDTSITAIAQTRDGYFWIGTDAGFFRFDGLNFKLIPLLGETTNRPPPITSVCEDNSGALWIGTENSGVYKLQAGRTRRFGTHDGLLDERVTSLALDKDNRIWIGTARGLNRVEDGHFSAIARNESLKEYAVLNVHASPSGHVWITTSAGIFQYVNGKLNPVHFASADNQRAEDYLRVYEDRRGNLWGFCSTYLIDLTGEKRINYFPGEKSDATRIWNLCEGRDGRLWIGAAGRGLFCFDGLKFQPVTLNEGRWPNDVRTIYESADGSLWLGIAGVGLVQLRAQAFTLLMDTRGLPTGAATAVVCDAGSSVYVGMESGGIYKATDEHFDKVSPQDHFLGQELFASIAANADGTIWAGTPGNGLYRIGNENICAYTTANGLLDDSILSVCSGASNTVWIGTRLGDLQRIGTDGIKTFTRTDGLTGSAITALRALPDGGLLIGTANGELLHAENGFRTVTSNQVPARIAGKPILGLCVGTNSTLWIGSDGGGLGFVGKGIQRSWDSQDGLPDNTVWDMVEDEDGNLWLATPKGLCRVSSDSIVHALARPEPIKVKLMYETEQTTARVLRFCGPRAARSANGRLWFALNSGLAAVDIHGRERETQAPKVHIESILVDHKPVAINQGAIAAGERDADIPSLELPATLKNLEIQFTGLSFDAPEKVRFRHKMDGIDADWVTNGSERQISYGQLPSKKYVFHVTACNADGVWNDRGDSIAIIIPPPFWRTPLAMGTAGFMAIAFVVGTVRVVSHRRLRTRLERLQQQQAMERERIRIAQNMHDEIGSKLTKISYLSERARTDLHDGAKAAGKIDSIASTSRELLKALDEIVWAVNPRNDTLEHLAAYFCQYAREYFQDTNVECDLRIQSQLPDVEMTAEMRHNLFLALEEALNNILKHSKASQMKMDISTEPRGLRISIKDNGTGFDSTDNDERKGTGGNGLRNIRQRLTALGGSCVVESSPASGTAISLSVPLDFGKIRHSS